MTSYCVSSDLIMKDAQMEKETSDHHPNQKPERVIQLLNRSIQGKTVTVRDDQYEYSWLMDAVTAHRRKGNRFRLVDSGFLEPGKIQWMAEAGADIYTADNIGRGEHDLVFFQDASRKGRAITALFQHGPITEEEAEGEFSFSQLKNLGGSGVYVHASNMKIDRDLSLMAELAYSCAKGGGWLVYYHHGPLQPACIHLAESGSWIHISDQSLTGEENFQMVMDMQKAARKAGTGIVLVVESKINLAWLWDIIKAGGFILFKNRHFDFKSPFRAVQEEASERMPDFKAFYLNTTSLP